MPRRELVVVAAAGALLGPAPAGASMRSTRALPDCLGHPRVEPKEVVFACADGNFYADHLTWLGWGGPRAVALGTAHLNDCTAGLRRRPLPSLLDGSDCQRDATVPERRDGLPNRDVGIRRAFAVLAVFARDAEPPPELPLQAHAVTSPGRLMECA
jgi:hypothetical protein